MIQQHGFKEFSLKMLEFIQMLISNNKEDQLKESISKLFDVCLISPHFIKKRFDKLIYVMAQVRELEQDQDSNLRIESVECLVNVVEKYPDLS